MSKKRTVRSADAEVSIQIAVRIPGAWITRADALAETRSKEGLMFNRAMIIRRAIAIGLEALEGEKA
jgi:hypothetical protein